MFLHCPFQCWGVEHPPPPSGALFVIGCMLTCAILMTLLHYLQARGTAGTFYQYRQCLGLLLILGGCVAFTALLSRCSPNDSFRSEGRISAAGDHRYRTLDKIYSINDGAIARTTHSPITVADDASGRSGGPRVWPASALSTGTAATPTVHVGRGVEGGTILTTEGKEDTTRRLPFSHLPADVTARSVLVIGAGPSGLALLREFDELDRLGKSRPRVRYSKLMQDD